MDRLGFSLEVKSLQDSGQFSGLASTYGNLDHMGDVVVHGAFADSLSVRSEVPILWAHDMANPVGLGKLSDTQAGLLVDGTLDLDVQTGKDAFSRLKKRIVRGLSIGFTMPAGGYTRDADGVRHLKKINLHEVSLVAIPANERAVITSVKSIGSIRDLERFLHEAGFSKRESTAIASHGYKGLAQDGSEEEELLEFLRSR